MNGADLGPFQVRSLFLSDVHLGTRACQAERLLAFLRRFECEQLYLVGDIIDFWAENGLEHERCGEMIERIGLVNFLEGVGLEVDPNMINHPRTISYIRTDEWDKEAEKWFDRKKQAAG